MGNYLNRYLSEKEQANLGVPSVKGVQATTSPLPPTSTLPEPQRSPLTGQAYTGKPPSALESFLMQRGGPEIKEQLWQGVKDLPKSFIELGKRFIPAAGEVIPKIAEQFGNKYWQKMTESAFQDTNHNIGLFQNWWQGKMSYKDMRQQAKGTGLADFTRTWKLGLQGTAEFAKDYMSFLTQLPAAVVIQIEGWKKGLSPEQQVINLNKDPTVPEFIRRLELGEFKSFSSQYLDNVKTIEQMTGQTANPQDKTAALLFTVGVNSLQAAALANVLKGAGQEVKQISETVKQKRIAGQIVPEKTIEQLTEELGGWKAGIRTEFDTALYNKDTETVKRLLPEVPEEYKQRFATEIAAVVPEEAGGIVAGKISPTDTERQVLAAARQEAEKAGVSTETALKGLELPEEEVQRYLTIEGEAYATPEISQKAHTLASEKGLTQNQYKRLAVTVTGKSSTKQMTPQEADDFVEVMDALRPDARGKITIPKKRFEEFDVDFVKATKEFDDLPMGKFTAGEWSPVTPDRAARIVGGDELMDKYVRPAWEAEAELRVDNRLVDEQVTLWEKIVKPGSNENQVLIDLAQGNVSTEELELYYGPEKAQQMNQIAKQARTYYDNYLTALNEQRVRFGLKEIPKRANYVTQMEELTLLQSFGFDTQTKSYDDAIKFIQPNAPGNPFAKPRERILESGRRIGLTEVFQRYARTANRELRFTEPIQMVKQYNSFLPSDAQRYFSRWSNQTMAGIPTSLTQLADELPAATPIKRFGNWLTQRFAQNAIVGNINTIVLQPSSIAPTIGEVGPTNAAAGHAFYLSKEGYNFAHNASTILKERTLSAELPKGWGKISRYAAVPLEAADQAMVGGSFLGGVRKALIEGQTIDEAIKYGDDVAAMTQAAYLRTARPPILRHQLMRSTLGMFQTFTNNIFNHVFIDIPLKAKGQGLLAAGKQAGLLVTSVLAINQIYKKLKLPQPWDLRSFIPFIGSAKFGPPAVVGIAERGYTAIKEGEAERLAREFWMIVPPFGGSQARKTLTEVKAYKEGAKKTTAGKVLETRPAELTADQISRFLFGGGAPIAIEEAKKREEVYQEKEDYQKLRTKIIKLYIEGNTKKATEFNQKLYKQYGKRVTQKDIKTWQEEAGKESLERMLKTAPPATQRRYAQ